jgi:hypothetical protein
VADPYGRILGFLDQSEGTSIQLSLDSYAAFQRLSVSNTRD